MLLALDINSVRCGWAFGGPDDSFPRSDCWLLPGGADLTRSCMSLYNSISELSKLIHTTICVIEAPLNIGDRNPRSNLVLIALYGAANAAAGNAKARVIDAHVSTWRKTFLGMGYPPKGTAKQMALDRCKLLRWPAENHDQAEACGIWCWGMSISYPHWAPKGTPLFAQGEAA